MERSSSPGDLPVERPHRTGCGTPRPSRRGLRRALVLVGVHVLVAAHVLHWKLSGRTLSPLEPSEAGETLTQGVVNAGFVLLVLLILGTLVLGRFFCGWACHVVAYQDACAWLLGRLGLRPRPVRSRLLVLVPALAAFWMFVLPSLLQARTGDLPDGFRWQLQTSSFWERFPGPWIAVLTLLVDGFLVVWLLGAKGFCTYGCPYGALFGGVDRFARGRIRVTDACEGCGHCTATCTSNVRVHEEVARYGMVVDSGCMKCMDCVSVCPKDALYFGFGASRGKAVASKRPRRNYDFTWPEELVMAGTFAVAFLAFLRLYELVPLLLAVGLAVLSAVAAVVLWRVLRRGDLTVQRLGLKRGGRLTSAGRLGLGVVVVYLAFAAHSATVQADVVLGKWRLGQAAGHPNGTAARAELLEQSARHLERASERALVGVATWHNMLGQIHGNLGRGEAAETHLRRAIELAPGATSALVWLAELRSAAGDQEEAVALLARAARNEATEPAALIPVARALAAVLGRDPHGATAEEARRILDGIETVVREGRTTPPGR